MLSRLDLRSPIVMGILNVTPDSFSDGGAFIDIESALAQAMSMVDSGAAIIDVGGESTRPYASEVCEEQELARVIPVIEALRQRSDVMISIDSRKPEVMRAALAAGASMINDVNALMAPGALELAAQSDVPLCLMHMQGSPQTMQDRPDYDGDILISLMAFFRSRIEACDRAGICRSRIVLDPGIGFGKTLAHNLRLLNSLPELLSLDCPLLLGASRKSMIGEILDQPVNKRLIGSVILAAIAAMRGVSIIRAHDVAETVDALKMVQALMENQMYTGCEVVNV